MKKNSNYKPIKKYILAAKINVKNSIGEKEFYDTFGFYNSTKDAIEHMKSLKKVYFDNSKVHFKIAKVTFYEHINN